ncbi:MAG: transglutaminase-like domain-containing protein [Acidobacteriota bacterium]|nr:transglutaminase-like domain-containing protein [Acidobacteriota bacterium]
MSNKKEPKYQSYNFSDTKFVKDEKGFYLARRTNVPSLKEEPRMPPSDMVRPWMMLQGVSVNLTSVSAFSISFSIKDPSNPNSYWATVGNENSGLTKFMNKPDKEIKRVAAEVTASASTPEEKLRKLYGFCQTQIKNISFDISLTDDQREKLPKNKSVGDVLKNKSASSQFIDMLFGAMANSLGYETRIAFTGDRSKMFFNPDMTNESFIHPAAIAVKVGNDWQFFNPGVNFLPVGTLVWYEEDVWALIIGENNYSWVKTPLSGTNKTVSKRTGKFKLIEDGTLEGTVKMELSGQVGLDYKLGNYDKSANQREEDLKNEIKTRMSTAEISDIQIGNIMMETEKPFVYQYKVRVPNYAQKTGKRLFLQPGFFEYGESAAFSTTTRKYDVYFNYPWSEEDTVEIDLPKGFSLDNADTPGELSDPQKIGFLQIKIGVDKTTNFMKYQRKFHFGGGGNLLFPVGGYKLLKNMFDAFHKADTHTITLKQN